MFSEFWRCLIPRADNSIIQKDQLCPMSTTICPISTTTFDTLPYDLVGIIFGNLPIGDRVRMRLVDKSWRNRLVRSDFPVKPEPPWRLLPIDSFSQPKHLSTEISFESMSEKRTYRFELPVCRRTLGGRYRWCCWGSSSDGGGWLLIAGRRAGRDLSKTVMLLWDPISGTTKRLPALTTLPFFSELVANCKRAGIENISTSLVIIRAGVFSVGSVECVVAVVFAKCGLALCSPQDQSWSVVPYDGNHHADMLFHNGKLFTLWTVDAAVKSNVGSVPVVRNRSHCTVRLSCCDVEVTMSDLVYEDQHHLPVVGYRSTQERNLLEHLVAWSAGELLVVTSIYDGCPNMSDQGLIFQTKRFEVYVLDVENANNKGLCCLERLRNVGRQCIFVGATGSTLLTEAAAAAGVDYGNIIHFATSDVYGACMNNEEEGINELNLFFVFHQQGVFDMVRDKIERTFSTNLSIQTGSCTGWFMPKLRA